jgi:general secretion pathway protein F
MKYSIRAVSEAGTIENVIIDAVDIEQLNTLAIQQRLHVVSAREIRRRSYANVLKFNRAEKFVVSLFAEELHALLTAGLSLIEALRTLLEKEGKTTNRDAVKRIVMSLDSGTKFSAALSEQPGCFPPLFIGVIAASEKTNDLPKALKQYLEYDGRGRKLKEKIVSASIYPATLIFVGVFVTAFLAGYVVPKFAVVYEGSGREMPVMSALLLQFGAFVAAHFTEVLTAALILITAFTPYARHLFRRLGFLGIISCVPIFRAQAKLYELSKIYMMTGMLLNGGVPLTAALRTVQTSVPKFTGTKIELAQKQILEGQSASAAFATAGLSTAVSARLLKAGEQSGKLGSMLTKSAEFYDGEIGRWIDMFTRIFEPALMVLIGLVVGIIVILLYMPIFDLAGSIS